MPPASDSASASRPTSTPTARWPLGFVRRRPFPWVLLASVVVAWTGLEYAQGWRWSTESDTGVWFSFFLAAAALFPPFVVLARYWRRVGPGMRIFGALVGVLWWLTAWHQARYLARQLGEWAPKLGVAAELMRAPREAMRVPPDTAVERALAAGDTSFLATGGSCGQAVGVDSAVAARVGVRVIRGTYHDGPPLTNEHGAFLSDAYGYALYYNDVLARRLGVDPTPPGTDFSHTRCQEPSSTRRPGRFFWP